MSKADPTMADSPTANAPNAVNEPSAAYRGFLRAERRGRILVRAAQLGLLVAFLIAWEFAPRYGWVNPMFTSYPSALWPTFVELLHASANQPGLMEHTAATVLATVVGFSAAMVLGVIVASALWWWKRLYLVFDPFLVVANAMPKIAFVPIFYIWLGATLSIYGMALAISVFITILMVHAGFEGVDPNKVKLAQTFGASRWQVLHMVVLPGSVPTLIATLKVNTGLALVGVVVGEFQSANLGLGYLIQYGSQIFKLNIVMTAITLLAMISALMYLAIAWLERRVMARR